MRARWRTGWQVVGTRAANRKGPTRRSLSVEPLEPRLVLSASVRISEIMYNPTAATAAEQAAGYSTSDFEFLELTNTGTDSAPLAGWTLANGVEFTFPSLTLAPGGYVVVAADTAAFAARYPAFGGVVAGAFSSSLSDGGEKLELSASGGVAIQEFTYDDGWYAVTDGEGYSLTVRDAAQDAAVWDSSDGWRASAAPGGSPGYADTLTLPDVVINEVLAHSDEAYGDAIELHNLGNAAVDVSGWYLSDDPASLAKYQIAEGTVIAAGGYLVVTQVDNFGVDATDPGAQEGFGLSEYGDVVYLTSSAVADGDWVPGDYRIHVEFGVTPNGHSVGRYVTGTGDVDFPLLAGLTFGTPSGTTLPGAANSDPYSAPLVVSEVMYNPAPATAAEVAAGYATDDFEYVELHNNSTTAIRLDGNPYTSLDQNAYYLSGGAGFTFGWVAGDGAADDVWSLESGAAATWNAAGLASGATYHVYATFKLEDGTGVARDLDDAAQYTIYYAGGSTTLTIDQDDSSGLDVDNDSTVWVDLGSYAFANTASVVLSRGTASGAAEQTIAGDLVFQRSGYADVVVQTPTLSSPFLASGLTTIPAGGYLVLAANRAAFDLRYGNGDGHIAVAGSYGGQLADNGGDVNLLECVVIDADTGNGYIPVYTVDGVTYGDSLPEWPVAADGFGDALQRRLLDQYAQESANWAAGDATPGAANVRLVHCDAPNSTQIRLFFSEPLTAASAQAVDHYTLSGASVSNAALSPAGTAVTLTLSSPLASGTVYTLTASDLQTMSGHALPGAILTTLTYGQAETAPPRAMVEAVTDPHDSTLSSVSLVFSKPVSGLDLADLSLTRNGGGNLLGSSQSLTTLDGITWTLGNLGSVAAASGSYRLALTAVGSAIVDTAGNSLLGDATERWTVDASLALPTASIAAVSPALRNSAVSTMTVVFSEAVTGFDLADLSLNRSGGGNLLTGAQTLTTADNITWTVGNLAGVTAANGSYTLTLNAADSAIADIDGGRLSVGAATGWVMETVAPTAAITGVSPDPRNSAVSTMTVVFSEAVSGFDPSDLSLKRNGGSNLLTAGQTLTSSDNITWTLGNLAGLTGASGGYVLTLATAGIADLAGNSLAAGTAESWTVDAVSPMAAIPAVSPDPRNSAVSSLTVVFSEAVTGFELSDLSLKRNGGSNLLTGGQTLATSDNITWTLGNLVGLTGTSGSYVLTLAASGSSIADVDGNPLADDASTGWTVDAVAPTAAIPAVSPDPRNSALSTLTIVFSEAIAGFDLSDLSLTRSGGSNLLGAAQSLTTSDNITWTLGNLGGLTGASGSYVLTLVGSGIADPVGNRVAANIAESWTVDATPPMATIPAVSPDPRDSALSTLTIAFSEAVTGFDLSDLALKLAGGGNLLTAAQTLTTSDGITWSLGHLDGVTSAAGTYTLTLATSGTGIADTLGNTLATAASASWVKQAVATLAPTTIGLFDPQESVFYLRNSNSTGYADTTFGYGQPGSSWQPIVGDWDGDVDDTIGFFDPDTCTWYLRNSLSAGFADYTFGYGDPAGGWTALVGDWDGNGTDTIGFYDPHTGTWYLRNSLTAGFADYTFGYGDPAGGWTPIVGDWDGNGTDTIGFYDPKTGLFYLRNSLTSGFADYTFGYGDPSQQWTVLIGDWDANRTDTIGFYDPNSSMFYLRNALTAGFADLTFGYGAPGWEPMIGNWVGMVGAGLSAAETRVTADATVFTLDQLQPLVAEAIAQFAAAGTSAATLHTLADATWIITDLPGTQLGWAATDRVYLDRDAAGHGWFVDATPQANEEHAPRAGDSGSLWAVDPRAVDQIDLLTVVEHELGHLAGLDDLDPSASDLMAGTLPVGVRRTVERNGQ